MNQIMTFFSSIDKKTWIIIAVAIVLLIVLIVWLKNRNNQTITTTVIQPATNNNNSGSGNDTFPLRNGSRGENVKKWQTYVNSKGGKLTVDGIWGPLTEADSLKWTGFNSVTMDYFNTVVK